MSLTAAHAASTSPDLAPAEGVALPEGYRLAGGPGHYYWTRGELVGPLGWGDSARATAEACAADARAHAAANPLRVVVPPRAEVEDLVAALLSPRALRSDERARLAAVALDPRWTLRYACASSGLECGPGCARQAAWSLSVLGVKVDARDLHSGWVAQHLELDRLNAYNCPHELRANTRDALSYGDREGWRRALIDAFDAVKRPGMTLDEQASAWSHVSARWYALHLLGVRVAEVADLPATARGWLPRGARK